MALAEAYCVNIIEDKGGYNILFEDRLLRQKKTLVILYY